LDLAGAHQDIEERFQQTIGLCRALEAIAGEAWAKLATLVREDYEAFISKIYEADQRFTANTLAAMERRAQ